MNFAEDTKLSLRSLFSSEGDLLHGEHVAVTGDVLVVATGIKWEEPKGAAKHPATLRLAPHNQE